MNMLKWILGSSNKDDSRMLPAPVLIENLVEKIREEHEALEETKKQLHAQKILHEVQRKALEKARSDTAQHKKTIATLESTIATQGKTIQNISTQDTKNKRVIQQLQNEAKSHGTKQQRLRQQVTNLQTSNTTLIAQAQADRAQANTDFESLRRENIDLRYDVQLLERTQNVNMSQTDSEMTEFSLLPQPFVLVLVDGDSYDWAACHWSQVPGSSSTNSPGAHAAQAIRQEVQKYIIDNKESIPLQSRIVTRVFMNIPWRSKKTSYNPLQEFAKTFTESTPLFDFFDAGEGKERVDEKIKETFHLFASNPSCHAIFFAAARDNGFARLLEQYNCIPQVKSKVVIIHPGYIARELASLGYASAEWPNVFKRQYMTPMEQAKEKRLMTTKAAMAEDSKNTFKAELHKMYTETVGFTLPRTASTGHYGVNSKLQTGPTLKGHPEGVRMVEDID